MLTIKERTDAGFDLVSLGEILLRFDPREDRIADARSFAVFAGGAEFNVAANLSRVFGARTSIATAVRNEEIGRLVEGFARSAGVDTANILRTNEGRNGIYFIERGFGLRPPSSAFDRGGTAVSKFAADEKYWADIFAKGVRWFHTGGIFAGLSDTTPAAASAAMKAARESGAVVSFDLNYRDSLWRERGGREAANAVNRQLLPFADVVFGVFDTDPRLSDFDAERFAKAAEKMRSEFPALRLIVSTLRETHSASVHDLGAAAFADGNVTVGNAVKSIDVHDRVGSGDAFAAGFIYGVMEAKGVQFALDCGVALGALAMTTAGDTAAVSAEEVFAVMKGETSAAKR